MCLGVPGRIQRIRTDEKGAKVADADFIGEVRTICLDYLPELVIGDYVIVHAGYALTKLSEDSAQETIRMMVELELLDSSEVPAGASAIVESITTTGISS